MKSQAEGIYLPVGRRAEALNLLGLPVHAVDARQVLDFMAEAIAAKRQAVILHLNVFGANLAARNPWLKAVFHDAQLVFCDGDGIRWGLRILGRKPPPKITYNEWLWQMADWCQEHGFSVYLLGGRPGVAQRAARNLEARNPDLRILGTHDGYFEKEGRQSETVVAEINRLHPDILLVCFGMPIQERWLRDNSSRLAVHVLLTGGAALDYAAGIIPVAPRWMKGLQIEWLFRFLREPVRLFGRYVIGNPRFMARVLAQRVRRSCKRRGTADS